MIKGQKGNGMYIQKGNGMYIQKGNGMCKNIELMHNLIIVGCYHLHYNEVIKKVKHK